MNILDYIIERTYNYIQMMPKEQRKKYGQFFTSRETAVFMSRLLSVPTDKSELKILDAGAGSGVLSAALAEELQKYPDIKRIELVCYENDPNIINLLNERLFARSFCNISIIVNPPSPAMITSSTSPALIVSSPSPTRNDSGSAGRPAISKVSTALERESGLISDIITAGEILFLTSSISTYPWSVPMSAAVSPAFTFCAILYILLLNLIIRDSP